MKQKTFEKYIKLPNTDLQSIEDSIVVAYVKLKKLVVVNAERITNSIEHSNELYVEKIIECLKNEYESIDLYAVIDLFETIVSDSKKKTYGIVYTPRYIQELIINSAFAPGKDIPVICDPSSGCGAFLLSAAKWLNSAYNISISQALNEHVVGIELSPNAVRQTFLLLDLLLLEYGEKPLKKYNVICGDSTDKLLLDKLIKKYGHFDYVVGNPPYVRSKNIGEECKKNLHYWNSATTGNVDLYIPFYEIGLYLLKKGGELGYISPNTFMQALNGRGLRKDLLSGDNLIRIIDFRDSQVFAGVTSYTCVVWIKKGVSDRKILYSRIKDPEDIDNISYGEHNYNEFTPDKRWRMYDTSMEENIYKLEHTGRSLDSWKIRNGLATLKNDLFFFTPDEEDEKYYSRTYCGKQYKIEKSICINVCKPNTIRNETDLINKMEKAIFPYVYDDGVLKCINEKNMKKSFPKAYLFLCDYKEDLLSRDKGKGDYPEWFAYGRTQGMNNYGKKILIPYISGEPIAVICDDPNVLFYCGYALIDDDEIELRILKCFLESDAFWYYISNTSKPYSKGYMAFAKNYIASFSIPVLNEEEKKWLLSQRSKKRINSWIWSKYGIDSIS